MPDSVNYPNFPQQPIFFKDVAKVNKGRYATLELHINTDGTLLGHFTVENMQALAGCHITGHYDIFDDLGNVVARVHLPNIGLNPAWFAKIVTRHHDFIGKIKDSELTKVRRIAFTGYEDAVPQGHEIRAIFEELKNAG